MTVVWSYGGGTQSIAIAVLIAQGKLPRPDLIVIADTSREASETWEYTDRWIRPMLGQEIHIAPHSLVTRDLYSSGGKLLLGAYTEKGRFPFYCSSEWKQRVVRRWMRQQGVKKCVLWLGISWDENDRMRVSEKKWVKHHYPLCEDIRMTRSECIALVKNFGLPDPPKSSCWCCPNRLNEQWKRLRDVYPADWAKAVALDEEIRAIDSKHAVYLHKQRVPLSIANLNAAVTGKDDDAGCMGGVCYV